MNLDYFPTVSWQGLTSCPIAGANICKQCSRWKYQKIYFQNNFFLSAFRIRILTILGSSGSIVKKDCYQFHFTLSIWISSSLIGIDPHPQFQFVGTRIRIHLWSKCQKYISIGDPLNYLRRMFVWSVTMLCSGGTSFVETYRDCLPLSNLKEYLT